jgi:Family of unknown function (DUF6152)
MTTKIRPLAGAGIFMMVCATLLAHHGTGASYDASKEITLTGVVTQFNWHNPHAQLYFDVKDESGKVVSWGAELNSPGVLAREGWTKSKFKPGDVITITVNPSKAGTPTGNTVRSKPILVGGKEVVAGRPGRTTVD